MHLVVFIFTFLLFLSGYVLQQQTVRSLQAALRPPPAPTPTPPSPVLAKHFGTPPGHSFYDKYLASNRPKGGWAKAAYVQLVRQHLHVCNALMLFAELEGQESMAQRVIMYPKDWDTKRNEQTMVGPQVETSRRLLKDAAKRYRVMLQPVEPILKTKKGENNNIVSRTYDLTFWIGSIFPLAGLLSLSHFNRLLYLPPSGLVLDTGGLDHLFTLPMESAMLGISAGTEQEVNSPSIILFQPSTEAFQETISSLPADKYDEDAFLGKIPILADLPEDRVHVVAKTSGLRSEDDGFNATEFLEITSYVQILDPDMLGPEFDNLPSAVVTTRPREAEPRKAWQTVYERYGERRMDTCGLDLEPVPRSSKES